MAGLFADHPEKSKRERWEITAGKVMILGQVSEEIATIPAAAPHLMGEKPILERIEAARKKHRSRALMFAARSCDPMERLPDFCHDEWSRSDAVSRFLSDFLRETLSGNAEEQPGPREESRPSIGNIPVTAAGANPPDAIDGPPVDSPPVTAPDSGIGFRLWASFHEAFPEGSLSDWLASLPPEDVQTISESCLDELERRGDSARWGVS